jgi:tRNA nucleotidyltransferase (CCA-adding enzyme)
METYLVGGAIRDELLGRDVEDRDWVVIGATPEDLISQGYVQIGNTFPCFLHPQTREEYALARTERKSGRGHQGFICDFGPEISLEEDLSRRDLTINAIAKSSEGQFIDPNGGIADLNAKLLRHVSPAFSEDPLRVLRVARFATRYKHLGFTIHKDTLALMSQLSASGELRELTAERVWNELLRALGEKTPSEFFSVLHSCGALAELLPELAWQTGMESTPSSESLTLDTVSQNYSDPVITWAVLLHSLEPGSVQVLCERLKTPREFLDLARLVTSWGLEFENIMTADSEALLDLIQKVDGFRRPSRLDKFATACASARPYSGSTDVNNDPRLILLAKSASRARQVDTASLQSQGLKGEEFAAQLKRQRELAIENLLHSPEV